MSGQELDVRRQIVSRAHVPKPLEELGVVIGVEEDTGRELIVIPPAVRDAMNVLDPVQSFAQARPDWSPAIRVVQLDPDANKGPHFYKQAGGKLAPTKQALELLAKAANIEVATTRRMPKEELADGERLGYYAKVKIRTASGTLEELERSQVFVEEAELEEIKTAVTNAKAYENGQSTNRPRFDVPGSPTWEAEVRKRWLAELKNSSAKTESKAVLRAIRAALQIPHTFEPGRASLPFVVIGFNFTPDQSDPEVRRMLVAAGLSATNAVYGNKSVPQLDAGPSTPAEEPADELPAAASPDGDAGAQEPPEGDGRASSDGEQSQQADGADSPLPASSVPGDDEEPKVGPTFPVPEAVIEEAGQTVIPKGDQRGKTLAAMMGNLEGEAWLGWALRRPESHYPPAFRSALELFVSHKLPDVFSRWQAEREEAAINGALGQLRWINVGDVSATVWSYIEGARGYLRAGHSQSGPES